MKTFRKVIGFIDFYADKQNPTKWYFVLKSKNGRNIGRSPNYSGLRGAKEALRKLLINLHSYLFTVDAGLLYCYSRSNGHILFSRSYLIKDMMQVNKITENFMNLLSSFASASNRQVYRQKNWVRHVVTVD